MVVEREMAQQVRYHDNLRAAEDTDFAIRLALAGCRFRMLEAARRDLERRFPIPAALAPATGARSASAPGWHR